MPKLNKQKKIWNRQSTNEVTSYDSSMLDAMQSHNHEIVHKRYKRFENFADSDYKDLEGHKISNFLRKHSGKDFFSWPSTLHKYLHTRLSVVEKAIKVYESNYRKRLIPAKTEILKLKSYTHQVKIADAKFKRLTQENNVYVRLDNIGRIITELGKKDAFAGKEIATTKVLDEGFRFKHDPHQVTQWDHTKYNGIAYLQKEAFSNYNLYEGHLNYKWGTVTDIGQNPILAIQVMDSDPKHLFEVTKGMLKKRPKDPVAVLNYKGEVFFP